MADVTVIGVAPGYLPRLRAAVRLLTDGDMGYQPGAPTFVTLAASVLGNVATDTDGFDATIAPAMNDLESDAGAIGSLDTDLAAVAFAPGDFEAAQLAPIAADVQTFVDANESTINALTSDTGQDITPPAPPAPPDPAPPGGTGGGGGGGDNKPGSGGSGDNGPYLFDPGWGDPYWREDAID